MKVILLEDVRNQGKKGDVVEVSQGYGQNFLIKTKKGVLATKEELSKLEQQNQEKQKENEEMILKAKEEASELVKYNFEFAYKARDGQLFKSVSKKELAKNISNVSGQKINSHKLELNVAKIQNVGEFKVTYTLIRGVIAKFNVKIVEL